MDKLLFTVKPFYSVGFKSIQALIIPVLFVLFFSHVLFLAFVDGVSDAIFIFFIMLLVMILISLIYLFFEYLNYQATTYKVYDDRIEFEEGFINHKYATLKWIDVKEIHFTQNFLQRIFGVGHIKFITAANTGYNGYNDGIKFRDIQQPKEIYDKLKKIHSGINA